MGTSLMDMDLELEEGDVGRYAGKGKELFGKVDFVKSENNVTTNNQGDGSKTANTANSSATDPITDDTDSEVFMIYFVIAGLSFILILATVFACI